MKTKVLALVLLALLAAQPVHAMHIMEGYLPLGWCLFWYAVAIPFVVLSYRHIRSLIATEPKMRISFSLNVAFVFILSALKLPSLTGSSSHLTGTTLGTLTTGVMSMPLVGFVVLLFQTLLLAHGGISTLGANIFSLAVVGPFVAYIVYTGLGSLRAGRSLAIFVAAVLGSLSTYITTSLQLAIVFPDAVGGVLASFQKFMTIFAYTQLPLSLVEGLLTLLVMRLIAGHSLSPEVPSIGRGRILALSLGALLCLALPVLGGIIDFGAGADDMAGEAVMSLSPSHDPSPFFSAFEPSEALEPWLFALQVLIGLVLFGWAIWAMRRKA